MAPSEGEVLQFAQSVSVVSSKANRIDRYNEGLIGRAYKNDDPFDFSDAHLLTTYGTFRWKLAPSYRPEFGLENVSPEDNAPIDEFVQVKYGRSIYPTGVGIYQAINPGAVARIWAYRGKAIGWSVLWDRRYDGVLSNSCLRLFRPEIRTVRYRTRELRIEFNTRDLSYMSGIDGIALVGVKDISDDTLPQSAVPAASDAQRRSSDPADPPSPCAIANRTTFTELPYDVLFEVFSHLDLKSLRSAEQVCKQFAAVVADARLYRVLNLRPYWYKTNPKHMQWLWRRCNGIKKLDLSWCSMLSKADVYQFLRRHGTTLTHLRLNSIGESSAMPFVLTLCPNLTELCMQNVCVTEQNAFQTSSCQQLIMLDLAMAKISTETVVALLQQNPGLQHLNLSTCEELKGVPSIIQTIGQYNRELISLNLFRTYDVDATILMTIKNCTKLQELIFSSYHGKEGLENELGELVKALPHLRWLELPSFRSVSDDLLQKLAIHCPELKYLNLDCCYRLTIAGVNAILGTCPALRLKLRFLSQFQKYYKDLRQQYPLAEIMYADDC
uniref:F-box domain-containing protein n=1 Tax=Anopheles christyi TaxID=43041 RepID=A0A182JVM7_9DIPT